MDRVAVVIPTRNRLPLLREAVASVRAQTMSSWRLIMIDDASDDGTPEWLKGIADDRIRVLSQPTRLERSRARNEGLATAESEFIMFLDDDDRLLPRAFEYLIGGLDRPRVVAAVGGEITFDERGHRKRFPHPRMRLTRDLRFDILAGWAATPGRWLLRTQVVRDAGGWDEELTYAEDADLWLRVAEHGPVAVLPGPVLEKRVHPGQDIPVERETMSEAFRLRFAHSLSSELRPRGIAAVDLRRERRAAEVAVSDERFAAGLQNVSAAVRLLPGTALSPLVRPALSRSVRRGLVGLVLGKSLFDLIRRGRAMVRRTSKRMPGED